MPRYTHIYNHKIKDNSNKTQSQLAKFKRQKCINLMEKLLKNLFRMFRDEHVGLAALQKRFLVLKAKIDSLGKVGLHSNYNKAMKKYIDNFEQNIFRVENLDSIRQEHLTQLNRIQKIKNESLYKKNKHPDKYY